MNTDFRFFLRRAVRSLFRIFDSEFQLKVYFGAERGS